MDRNGKGTRPEDGIECIGLVAGSDGQMTPSPQRSERPYKSEGSCLQSSPRRSDGSGSDYGGRLLIPRQKSSQRSDGSGSDSGGAPLVRRQSSRRYGAPRTSPFSTLSREYSTSELYAAPLASEGEGSIFPVDLPLAKRRAFEVEIIQKFDRLAINTNVGEVWFVIDAIWMNDWVNFVMGKADPPGPISNYNLYDEKESFSTHRAQLQQEAIARSRDGSALASRPDLHVKDDLVRVKDYRAVHPLVWFIFREIYDTDDSPLLARWQPDLYSAEVPVSRRHKTEEVSHTKAVYEIRRFVDRIKTAAQQEG